MDEIRGRERRLGNSEAKIRENLNVYLKGRKTSLAIGEKNKEKIIKTWKTLMKLIRITKQ